MGVPALAGGRCLVLPVFPEYSDCIAFPDEFDCGQRVVSEPVHGLEVARDPAIGLRHPEGAEGSGPFLLDLAHAVEPFGRMVGVGTERVAGKAHDLILVSPACLVPAEEAVP